jgi:hypothetical protein
MQLTIRQAKTADGALVADILAEAARWLQERGMPLRHADELDREAMQRDIAAGLHKYSDACPTKCDSNTRRERDLVA